MILELYMTKQYTINEFVTMSHEVLGMQISMMLKLLSQLHSSVAEYYGEQYALYNDRGSKIRQLTDPKSRHSGLYQGLNALNTAALEQSIALREYHSLYVQLFLSTNDSDDLLKQIEQIEMEFKAKNIDIEQLDNMLFESGVEPMMRLINKLYTLQQSIQGAEDPLVYLQEFEGLESAINNMSQYVSTALTPRYQAAKRQVQELRVEEQAEPIEHVVFQVHGAGHRLADITNIQKQPVVDLFSAKAVARKHNLAEIEKMTSKKLDEPKLLPEHNAGHMLMLAKTKLKQAKRHLDKLPPVVSCKKQELRCKASQLKRRALARVYR